MNNNNNNQSNKELYDMKEKIKQINIINLKSPILNLIFSYLKENKKLNIIINSKKFQKILNVNIKNYKKISDKYKIGERNGKGKEYIKFTKLMIFEGEYLNGKRNGKGKEYYNNKKLKYEGEYLNGKRLL